MTSSIVDPHVVDNIIIITPLLQIWRHALAILFIKVGSLIFYLMDFSITTHVSNLDDDDVDVNGTSHYVTSLKIS